MWEEEMKEWDKGRPDNGDVQCVRVQQGDGEK